MKVFRHFFQDRTCAYCKSNLSEIFWSDDHGASIHAMGLHCPECRVLHGPEQATEIARQISHIFSSTIAHVIRPMEERELAKVHGIMAWWFHVGREVYFEGSAVISKKVLVYMLNNHLQRLYFWIPEDAIE